MSEIRVIVEKISLEELRKIAQQQFGDMVKAVVDIGQGIMAIGGGMHADEEVLMLERGSKQENLWGINIYPDMPEGQRVEFDSMINIRPWQGNRSRSVEDKNIQAQITRIINDLIQ